MTLEELEKLAINRKAVVVPYYFGTARIPAAFVLNMQAGQVLRYIRMGMRPYRSLHCAYCGKIVQPKRSTRKYCNGNCRRMAHSRSRHVR